MPISMSDVSVVQNGNLIEVHGKSYTIREELKNKKARWNPESKVWYFQNSTVEKVTQILRDCIGGDGEIGTTQPKISFQLELDPQPKESPTNIQEENVRPPRTVDDEYNRPTLSRNQITLSNESTKVYRDQKKSTSITSSKAPKYEDIRLTLQKARIKWEHYMKEIGKQRQNADTMGSSIKVEYIGDKDKEAKYHVLIKYLDSSLMKYAEKIKLYIEGKGYKVIHTIGNKIV